MNWGAQLRHVAAKDVRQTQWPLLVYVGVITVAAVSIVAGNAFGPYSPTPSTEVLGMRDSLVTLLPALTIIIGLVSAVMLVQADSPTRANAFWASRPLSPSAVLAAKMVVLGVAIVALPLIAGFVCLRSLDVHGGAAAATLARAALSYAECILAVMVVGALTDDLRGFMGAFVSILAVSLVLFTGGSEFVTTLPPFAPAALAIGGVVGSSWLLGFLYRTRGRRARTWLAAAVATICLVGAAVNPPTVHAPSVPILTNGPALELKPVDPTSLAKTRQLAVELRVAQSSDSESIRFRPDSMSFHLLDGKDVRIDARAQSVDLGGALPQVGRAVRWIRDVASPAGQSMFNIEPFDFDRQAIERGVRSVTLTGTLVVSRSHVVASLPLRDGAVVTRDGRRFKVYGFSHDDSGADVWLQTSMLPRLGSSDLQYAIVNEERSEAMLVTTRSGSSGGSGSIVLPWIDLSTSFTRMSTTAAFPVKGDVPRDDAWYAGARLVVIEWKPVGEYRTQAEASVRQPGGGPVSVVRETRRNRS